MSRRYVDNAYNRSVGRVGQPLGSHVISRSSNSSASSSCYSIGSSSSDRTYVDNSYNRSIGRVGQPIGSHVVSRSSNSSASCSSDYSSTGQRSYVDNAYNRKVGRVGKTVGTHMISKKDTSSRDTSCSSSSTGQRSYVDNAYNRKVGRVGKPLGSHVISSASKGSPNSTSCSTSALPLDLSEMFSAMPVYSSGSEVPSRSTNGATQVQNIVRKLDDLDVVDTISPQTKQKQKKECAQASATVLHHVPGIIPHSELKYDDKKVIGSGAFGRVFACKWKEKKVAFKKLFCQQLSKKHVERFKNEAVLLASLDHPNTVKMFGVVIDKNNLGIVMEYLQRSLFQALFNDEEKYSKEKKKEMVDQIASALQYLHTKKIVHCDIKSANILLDGGNNAKLCDYGLSQTKNISQTSCSIAKVAGRGTPKYSAPEVLRGDMLRGGQYFPTDVYSLAVVVFEVVVEEEVYDDLALDLNQLRRQVGHENLRPEPSKDSGIRLSRPLNDLFKRCWDGDATKRPTAAEFLSKWKSINDFVVSEGDSTRSSSDRHGLKTIDLI